MRKRDHDAILAEARNGYINTISTLRQENDFLREQNKDLLNRAMSQDWTAYTALSAVPQAPIELPERIYDGTGLIDVFADDPE